MAGKREPYWIHIVDDDESVRRALTRLMRSAGYESTAYASAEAFLAQVMQNLHGCVLLDITLPRLTGLELQDRLVRAGVQLPVIAVSALDDDETRQRARQLGAKFFLRKPVDDQALLDAIEWVSESASNPLKRPGVPGDAAT